MIEIILNSFIKGFEKFDYRLVSFISPYTCLRPKTSFDTDNLYDIKRDFVHILKSIHLSKTFCIFLIVPILVRSLKYFKLRYQILHDAVMTDTHRRAYQIRTNFLE